MFEKQRKPRLHLARAEKRKCNQHWTVVSNSTTGTQLKNKRRGIQRFKGELH